jgi:hypothetical protein
MGVFGVWKDWGGILVKNVKIVLNIFGGWSMIRYIKARR